MTPKFIGTTSKDFQTFSSFFFLLSPLLGLLAIRKERKKAQITIRWFVGSVEGRETRESGRGRGNFHLQSLVGVILHNSVSTTRNVTNQFVRV